MTYQGFLDSLKKREDAHLFLICGENEHFRRESLKALFRHYQLSPDDLNVDRFDAKATDSDIILACRTLPFMGEKRLVIAEDFLPLSATKNGGEDMLGYLDQLPESAVLVFYLNQKPDKRKKLYKAIASQGIVAEFDEPAPQDVSAWVVYAFSNLGKTIGRPAVAALIERCGLNMTNLNGEIEKIASYVKADEVKTADVVKVASQSLEYNVFQIHDLLVKKNLSEALKLLNTVLEYEKSPFGIMGLIASKFRSLYKARTLMDAGYPQDEAIKLIGGHPYAAKMAMKEAKLFNAAALIDGINALAKADYLFKTGQLDADLALEKMLMEIYGI